MMLMVEIGDRAAQGRACGNLGNVHYLLGNFSRAIHFHQERLKIAKEFSDRAAERRAHSNLGNAHIFLGEFEKAAEHYKRTLHLAQELGDRAVEAQACYSLGNTYTLLKDYPMAVEYHLRHLRIAQELFDKVGEGRACWSLGNAHAAMGQHQEAYHYASKHLEISKDTGDHMGQATAQLNLAELSRTLGYPEEGTPSDSNGKRRKSMEQLDLLKMTPDQSKKENLNKSGLLDEEDFFDFISRFQSKRMDDQRCSLTVPSLTSNPSKKPLRTESLKSKPNKVASMVTRSASEVASTMQSAVAGKGQQKDELLDIIAGVQGHRMNEQRATVPFLPGLSRKQPTEILQRLSVAPNNDFPDESFFEMLMKCQGSRLEEQRSSLPNEVENQENSNPASAAPATQQQQHAPTVPDEDFFSLIQRLQGGRLEDQRASLPNGAAANGAPR